MHLKFGIIDYQAGNLRNVQKVVERLGHESHIISKKNSFDNYSGIILPGVGSFKKGMDYLKKSGLFDFIKLLVLEKRVPILGICLGMHLLASEGDEGGFSEGLNLLPMKVKKFDILKSKEKIPHMGWNNIFLNEEKSIILDGIPNNADFYFAHSYHVSIEENDYVTALCNYIYDFPATIEKDNIFAAQFHPEKSQLYGYQLLKNFLNFCKEGSKLDAKS
jgi:glutamine amidotransferase